MANARLAAVGAFVVGGILLFTVGLFLIGSRRMLFSDTFELFAEFSQIAALDGGAKVRVSGMDAGEVVSIRVPSSPAGKFRVRMRVRSDLHQLLRLTPLRRFRTTVSSATSSCKSTRERSSLLSFRTRVRFEAASRSTSPI